MKGLFKNRGAFLARTWVVSFAVGVAVMSICYLMVFGLATEYDNLDVIDENFDSTYNKYSELQTNIDSVFLEASSKKGMSVTGTFTTLFSATFIVIQLIFTSLLMPGAMLRQFVIDIGAPTAIANILFTLPLIVITVIIVMVIINFIGQGKM